MQRVALRDLFDHVLHHNAVINALGSTIGEQDEKTRCKEVWGWWGGGLHETHQEIWGRGGVKLRAKALEKRKRASIKHRKKTHRIGGIHLDVVIRRNRSEFNGLV